MAKCGKFGNFLMAKFANFCGKIWQNLGFQMAIFCDARYMYIHTCIHYLVSISLPLHVLLLLHFMYHTWPPFCFLFNTLTCLFPLLFIPPPAELKHSNHQFKYALSLMMIVTLILAHLPFCILFPATTNITRSQEADSWGVTKHGIQPKWPAQDALSSV